MSAPSFCEKPPNPNAFLLFNRSCCFPAFSSSSSSTHTLPHNIQCSVLASSQLESARKTPSNTIIYAIVNMMIRIQIEATGATVLLAICLAVALVCHFREEVVYHAVFSLLYVAFCTNQYLSNLLDLNFGSISISIAMDHQAAHTLAVIKNPDTPIDSKLGLLEKLKALIKHQNIPEAAVSTTFEVFRYAIYTSQLTALGFEGLSVLVRRLTNQGLLMAIAAHATEFYPLLTGMLGDLDDTNRIWAIKAFMEFWTCQTLEVSEVMQNIIRGGNPPMKISALLWVVKVLSAGLSVTIANLLRWRRAVGGETSDSIPQLSCLASSIVWRMTMITSETWPKLHLLRSSGTLSCSFM